ncbi:MAG: tetratricopeptide repeat protein, partial [Rhodobacteraceae bacterium]|nr:tetratricopeptide repeat protein [Paracoccaceae bacterium]
MEQLYDAGDYAGAEVAALAAAAQASAEFGPDSAQVLDVQITLANALRQQDKLEEAVAMFRHVHARWLATKGEYHPRTLAAANALSVILSETGRADEALPLAVQTVRVAETVLGDDAYIVVKWRYNLASTYSRLGYKDEALAYYAQALQQMRLANDPGAPRDAATVARTIARTLTDLGRSDAAADAYAEAIPLFEAAFGAGHPQTIYTQVEYGQALWRSGRRDDLPAHVQRVGALVLETFGAQSLVMSDVLAQRALLETRGGPDSPGFAAGLALQAEVVALRESLLSPTAGPTGRARLDLAAMLADTSDPAQLRRAWDTLKLAAEAGSGSRAFAYDLLSSLRTTGGMTPEEVADGVLMVAQEAQGSAAAASALILAQRLALGDGEAAAQFRAATDLGERSAQLQAALLVQTNLPLAERDAARESQMRRDLAETRQKADDLWAALDVSAPGMLDLIGGGRMTLAEVQAALGPDEALLVIDISPAEGDAQMAMAISREAVDWQLLNWTADSFPGAVADTRAGIALRLGTRAAAALEGEAPATGPGFDLYAAHWLYAETLAALEPVFAGKENLYFDLRGAVAGLPPQLLVVAPPESEDLAQADWLIRHHAVTVLPSVFALKTIALARGRPPAPEPLLAFGDPVYDLEEGGALVASLDAGAAGTLRGALAPLPETADE